MNLKQFIFICLLLAGCGQGLAQTPVWTQFAGTPSGTARHDDVYFVNETTGWSARGRSGIFKTTDAGNTWRQVNFNTAAHFRSIGFLTPMHGFAGNLGAGSYDTVMDTNNILYETFDGGETWTNHPGLFEAGMKGFCAMHILDSQHIYGVGRVRGPAHFTKSEDGGTNWTVVNLSPTVGTNVGLGVMGGMMDVYFKDTTNGWAVGMDTNAYNSCTAPFYHGAIARTTNGGLSWFVVTNTTVNCSYFWKMSWPTPNTGYVSLQQNAAYSTVVFYKTTNGGTTWSSNGIPLSAIGSPSSFGLQGIGFVSENEGWMGGTTVLNPPYSLIHTTNGGLSWTSEGYNNTRSINRFRFVSPTLGYMSGQTLHVYRVPLAITAQPQSQTNIAGSTATFIATGQGTAPITYQWRFNGSNISGANTNSYAVTNVQAANAGNYDLIISDYGSSVTSAVAVLTIEGAPVAPSIVIPPQSQTVSQGSNATFNVSASGTAPLIYQWRFNSTNIPGASGTNYVRTNAQLIDAGNYSVLVTNSAGSITSAVATLTVLTTNALFEADFDSYVSPSIVTNVGTTNGYKIFYRTASGPVDFKAIFGFDYSAVTYPTSIPSAPHSIGATTKGLYLTVNKDTNAAAAAAVNLYPVGQLASGNFALKFDMWINWADIDTSTEHTIFGINHSGNVTNRIGQTPSDGLFFAVEGENDSPPNDSALRDFSVFRGRGSGLSPFLMTTNNTTFGPTPLLGQHFDNDDFGFVSLFPSQTIPGYGSTPAGVAGLRWVSGEVRQENNLITWLLNGTAIAQYTNSFGYTNGTILLGYNDHFSSIGDSNNFAIFDNIRVEPIVFSPVTLLSPNIVGNDFSFSFASEASETYTVQRATDLATPNWATYTNLVGDGNPIGVLVPLTNNVSQQYFRVSRP